MKKLLFGIILLVGLIVLPIMSMAQIPVPLPPPIPFVGPPNVVVLPGTDIYAVPDIEQDLYFRQGWWWRHHGGHWYRSRSYDQGWGYYRGNPSWHGRIPNDWRGNYRNHTWGGRTWDPHHVNHGDINNHWRTDHGRGPIVHGGNRPAGRTHSDGRVNKSQGGGSHHNEGK